MNDELHRRAMSLDDEARALTLEGKREAAQEKFVRAAEFEQQCADGIGVDEPRSRGIVRVSAVSLWMEAGRLDCAESAARRYLAEPLLPGFHRELSDLLEQIAENRAESASIVEEPAVAQPPEHVCEERTQPLQPALEEIGHVPGSARNALTK